VKEKSNWSPADLRESVMVKIRCSNPMKPL